jgi:PilZ domain
MAPVSSAYASAGDRVAAVPLNNQRKHPRTKVTYKACIRRPGMPDDVVTCEDMSKGGLSFKSRRQYYERAAIEVAVPYSPGGNAIFVLAEIAWVVEITKDKQYKCGVAYRRVSRTS